MNLQSYEFIFEHLDENHLVFYLIRLRRYGALNNPRLLSGHPVRAVGRCYKAQEPGAHLVSGRLGGERILGGQHRAADENADENEVTPVRVRTELETNLAESVHVTTLHAVLSEDREAKIRWTKRTRS